MIPAQHVSAEQVFAQFRRSSATRTAAPRHDAVGQYEEDETRPCRRALRGAGVTPRERMTAEQRDLLELLMR